MKVRIIACQHVNADLLGSFYVKAADENLFMDHRGVMRGELTADCEDIWFRSRGEARRIAIMTGHSFN